MTRVPRLHRTVTKGQPNQGLDLTNPDAAQSVAGAPLCLLSGLAAQAHVMFLWEREASRNLNSLLLLPEGADPWTCTAPGLRGTMFPEGFRANWTGVWGVALRGGLFVNFEHAPGGVSGRRSLVLGTATWGDPRGGRAAGRVFLGGFSVRNCQVFTGRRGKLEPSSQGLLVQGRNVVSAELLSTSPRLRPTRRRGASSFEEAQSWHWTLPRGKLFGRPRVSLLRRGSTGCRSLAAWGDFPECQYHCALPVPKHNPPLLLTACLRRGRRCRPLAARTAAAEWPVGHTGKASVISTKYSVHAVQELHRTRRMMPFRRTGTLKLMSSPIP